MVTRPRTPVVTKLCAGTLPLLGTDLANRLATFKQDNEINTKGKYSQMLHLSRVAREYPLPLNAGDWVTGGGGQVKGAGGTRVQNILREYGIERRLSSEAGRTSRGSLGYAAAYIDLLNGLHEDGLLASDALLGSIEAWWVARVTDFFNSAPFQLRFDPAKNLRTVLLDLLQQAEKRQHETPGVMVVGAMLQHLVGAKLALALPGANLAHNNSSTADAPSGRPGDFLIGSVAIHVTTAPTEALMSKCDENRRTGNLHPVIVTLPSRLQGARDLAENANLQDHVELFDVVQFVSLNLLELGHFAAEQRRPKVLELVDKYNEIIDANETDPSLRIAT